jgi:hypothetical protein
MVAGQPGEIGSSILMKVDYVLALALLVEATLSLAVWRVLP